MKLVIFLNFAKLALLKINEGCCKAYFLTTPHFYLSQNFQMIHPFHVGVWLNYLWSMAIKKILITYMSPLVVVLALQKH